MSGIAEVMLNLGYRVSGSDLKESELTRRLAKLGARVAYGHRPENLVQPDVVVVSAAIAKDNPEILAARQRKIPVVPRAEMLAELMRIKYEQPSPSFATECLSTASTCCASTTLGFKRCCRKLRSDS